eukprot:comp16761_c0_seq1/m.15107 comp16761_c0_seq1/g.15107  ORF comp16761_c0_seq1/g.15107 comp16761_c0_seq1/m.15107 type:complete len:367 (-) comp16761_c0_seq1:578-1678(-)
MDTMSQEAEVTTQLTGGEVSVLAGHILQLPVMALQYPLTHMRILVQIGYEPVPPRLVTWLGSEYYVLPSGPAMIRYLYNTSGLRGLYRGFWSKNLEYFLYGLTREYTRKGLSRLFGVSLDPSLDQKQSVPYRVRQFVADMYVEVLSNSVALVTSFPVAVVHTRMIAQISGGETDYSGVFKGLATLWARGEWDDLYQALIPALIREVGLAASWVVARHLVAYFLPPWEKKEKTRPKPRRRLYPNASDDDSLDEGEESDADSDGYLSDEDDSFEEFARSPQGRFLAVQVLHMVATPWLYPFSHATTRLMVSGSGLVAGTPPYMPIYQGGWYECLSGLYKSGTAYQGAKIMSARRVPPSYVYHPMPKKL